MTYIYLVTNYSKARSTSQQIKEKLAIEIPPDYRYKIVYKSNKVEILERITDDNFIKIRTYIVIQIPVIVNFESLAGLSDDVYVNCEDLINELNYAIKKLRAMEGLQSIRGNNALFTGLVRSLYEISN